MQEALEFQVAPIYRNRKEKYLDQQVKKAEYI